MKLNLTLLLILESFLFTPLPLIQLPMQRLPAAEIEIRNKFLNLVASVHIFQQ